jgi:peptide-methionine (R)-S-oxide reductase
MTNPRLSSAGFDVARLAPSAIELLATSLSADERHVILSHGTERPFCGTLLDNKKHGTYVCRLCALPLFSSKSKFESGTGWPSFFQPYAKEHVEEITDESYGMVRVEIRCQRCGGHLGHVFPDGPAPTRLRYCLNSASLEFVEEGQPLPQRVDSDRGAPRMG